MAAEVQAARKHLQALVGVKPNRRTGSAGNREATAYFAGRARRVGFSVDMTAFPCLDYVGGAASLSCKGERFALNSGPYSLACDKSAPLIVATTEKELENCDCRDKILLLKGPICSEQLMPKNFVFYNPEHHRRIYALLEDKKPAGLIAATGYKPEQVGALHPYPLVIDGDFDIPNAYCTETAGERIAEAAECAFRLSVQGERIPSTASNVIARKNPEAARKIVLTAHIDAYENSPGASDNASGTVVLLLLAQLLGDYRGALGVEIAALNGEDHYSAGGQMDYLRRYGSRVDQVLVAVNIDGVGYRKGETAYSLFDCTDEIEQAAQIALGPCEGIEPGEQWYSGDHMIFAQAGRPAIAFTSSKMSELMRTITHTERDVLQIIDPERLVQLAHALDTLVRRL